MKRFAICAVLLTLGRPLAAQPADPPGTPAPPLPQPKALPKAQPKIVLDFTNPRIDEEMLQAVTETEGGELTRDIMVEVLSPVPDGLTPEQVAARAVTTSPAVAAARADSRAAAARVDQAFAAYFPTARVVASYTRLSEVPTDFDLGIPLPPGTQPVELPSVLNQWSLVASLEVPISDYVLRLTQAYAAVSHDVDAKQLEIEARKLQAAAEAKVAYYNWIRARGRAVVSGLAVALSNRHLDDANVTFAAGLISEADVARLEGQHAQSRHLLVTTLSYERVAADMLRRLMHLESGAEFEIGVDVLGEPPAKQARTLDELQEMARKHRLDLGALRTAKRSLDNVASATRANYYPRVDAFADAIYANPNQRIFPQQEKWDFTWDVGVRLTWTINDTFQTIGQSAEAEARVDGAAEQLRALEDGVASTVTQAFYDIDVARSAIETANTRERVAKTALEARRMLFRGGKSTATEIVDSEGELIEARLQRVDAHVDLLVARARLEHAVGTRVF